MRSGTKAAVAVLVLALSAPALAPLAGAGEPPNILVSFTVGRLDDGAKVPEKSYEMLIVAGDRAEMMTGARVPIPTTSFQARDGGEAVPMTSYTYQRVGFSATVKAIVLDGERISIAGQIEDSSIISSSADRPIIQTLNQEFKFVLRDGQPVQINKVDERETRSLYVDVRADIQK